tara:strand:+ start:783 stop:1826 length:1044 start_codon:yes stop_codon:yes gene_type:complete
MHTILLIQTGGTIGSKTKKNIVNVSKKNFIKSFLLKNIKKKIDYKIYHPINILSENASPNDWNNIIKCIEKNWKNEYSGIIITHGTDTLSYAASALSQYFYNFNKPIIIVSSDKPIEEKNSTGIFNLKAAINFISNIQLPGIYVPYKNPRNNFVSFFIGSRVKQINAYNNELNARFSNTFCVYKKNKFIFIKEKNPSILSIKKNCNSSLLNKKFKFTNKILMINPYPGLNYETYNLNKIKPKAILHTLYHSGTASTKNNYEKKLSLSKFIKKNKSKNIPFYISPLSNKNKNIYESLKILLNLNVRCLEGITVESAYAKLALAYGSFVNEKDRNNFLKKNNFFEKIYF